MIKFKKLLYVSLFNPWRTMKKLKGVYKPLKCYFKVSKYWSPVLWASYPAKIHIVSQDVGWKDKFDSPRYETPPYIWIHLFGLNLVWYWDLRPHESHATMDYWEQALWYLYYYNTVSYGLLDSPNIEAARKSWPWVAMNNKSTWNESFLVSK